MFQGKPVIAVTTSSNHVATEGKEPRQMVLAVDYVHAIALAGGIPVAACEECPKELAEMCDGLLLSGGPDLSPGLYGETIQDDSVRPDPVRDNYEWALFDEWMKTGKPVYGICRGCQFINVYFGGTLYQNLDLEAGFSHRDLKVRHPVTAEAGSILERLFGKEFSVNTIHHQAVKRLGAGLKATAHSPGGIVEAYEHETLPVFATQFHPEKLSNTSWDGTTKDFQPVFEYFVNLAKQYAAKEI